MPAPDLTQRVRDAVTPAVAGQGLVVEQVTVTGPTHRPVVQVVVDADEDGPDLDLDRISDVSADVSTALDDADLLPGAYQLEVSSPGADRPLTTPRHWVRALGRLVRAETADGRTVEGRLAGVDRTAPDAAGGAAADAGDAPAAAAGDTPGHADRVRVEITPTIQPGKGRPARTGTPVLLDTAEVRSARVVVELSRLAGHEDGDDVAAEEG